MFETAEMQPYLKQLRLFFNTKNRIPSKADSEQQETEATAGIGEPKMLKNVAWSDEFLMFCFTIQMHKMRI